MDQLSSERNGNTVEKAHLRHIRTEKRLSQGAALVGIDVEGVQKGMVDAHRVTEIGLAWLT